ncbi:MAG: transglutaminase domain-containing protein [Candidatus Margulisiibacteriota bacterium]
MRLEICHTLSYRYTAPVSFNPHLVRLQPLENDRQKLKLYGLNVSPAPSYRYRIMAIDGSTWEWIHFEAPSDYLTFETYTLIETRPWFFPPIVMDQLWSTSYYTEQEKLLLDPFIKNSLPHPELVAFATAIFAETGNRAMPFLRVLNERLSDRIRKESRQYGWPYPPLKTFRDGVGSCRDTAMLMVCLAQSVGFAARFVSGYIYDAQQAQNSELHAWTEIYVPRLGWVGFDPSYGVPVGEAHVALCASAFPKLCAPISGTFQGQVSEHHLETHVTMKEVVEEDPC